MPADPEQAKAERALVVRPLARCLVTWFPDVQAFIGPELQLAAGLSLWALVYANRAAAREQGARVPEYEVRR